MSTRWLRMAAWVGAVALAAGDARADGEAQPWAAGVTDAQKSEAQARLDEGNALFLAKNYKEALDKYVEATRSWDHPAIRFNIVRCLIFLDRSLEASENLQLALKYGAAPLEDAVYAEALQVEKLLAGQIGELSVSCAQDGAKLTLDGQPFVACPGKAARRVTPGAHGLVASKEGHLTQQLQVIVLGGKPKNVDIQLVPLDKAAKVVRRWPTWMPWVAFGSGLAVTGIGAFLQVTASSTMEAFDDGVASRCATTGCDLMDDAYADLQADYDRAVSLNKAAIGVMSLGLAGAAVGGLLLYLNRGRTVYEDPTRTTGPMVNLTPTSDGGMVSMSGRF